MDRFQYWMDIFNYLFAFLATIHFIVLLNLEIFYLYIKRVVSRQDSPELEALKWKSWAHSWTQYVAPVVPDLAMSTAVASFAVTSISIFLLVTRLLAREMLKHEKYSLFAFLYDRVACRRTISDRLDQYLNQLLMSNRCHAKKISRRFSTSRSQLNELDRELKFLTDLKLRKGVIWPSTRIADERRINEIRSWFLFHWLSFYIFISVTIQVTHYLYYEAAKSFVRLHSNRCKFVWTFWNKLFFMDARLITVVTADWMSTVMTIMVVEMKDHLETIKTSKESVKKFIQITNHLMARHSSSPFCSTSRTRLISNKLSLESYIKLRYVIDTNEQKSVSSVVHVVIILASGTLMLTLNASADLNPEEKINFLAVVIIIFAILNIQLISAAIRYNYCMKELNRLSISVASIIFESICEPDEHSHRPQSLLVSAHSQVLWQNFIRDNRELAKRSAVKIFGLFILDYQCIFRINAIIIWSMMLLMIYKRE